MEVVTSTLAVGPGAYHSGLLLLACGVGVVAALTTFAVYSRALNSFGRARQAWIALNTVATGLGVWATNFIALLAFNPGLETTYHPAYSGLSLLIAIALTLPVGAIVLRQNVWQVGVFGGLYIGAGISLVQISSLLAVRVPAQIAWHPSYMIAAVVVCMVFCSAALVIARPSRRWWQRGLAALLLTAAVAVQQFVSTAGLEFLPVQAPPTPSAGISKPEMTATVATIAMLLVGAALSLAILDRSTQRQAKRRLRELADAAGQGLVMCENGMIKDANRAFLDLLGLDREQYRNRPLSAFVPPEHRQAIEALGSERQELELLTTDNARIAVEIAKRDMQDGQGSRCVYAVQDIRERKVAEARIRFLAHHDALTGLANRVAFHERLTERLDRAWTNDEQFAVFCLDLDRFKEVNDVFGHAAGDAVLIEMTRRITDAVGADELVARIGGDEFTIVSGPCDPAGAAAFAERLVRSLGEVMTLKERRVSVNASIGIALFPSHGTSAETLLNNADVALYRAKAQGGGNLCFYNSQMDLLVRERRALANELAEALKAGAIQLNYQPLARVSSLEVRGFEVLARWPHSTRGHVPPSEFVALAEENGLVHELGLTVLRRACAEAATWRNPLEIAVNISPLQFQQGDLPEQILGVLMETGLPASRLELEITETVLMADFDRALSMLRRLKALGLRIAMDDFGTGWSSLSSLQAFPFDKVKIDRVFIDKIGRHKQAGVIVRAILGLCRSLEIPVLAEGVETEEQLDFLRREGCEELQGYLLARPAAIDTFAELVHGEGPQPALIKVA